jgi:hypothetical protein
MHWYRELMATGTHTDSLSELRTKILEALQRVGYGEAHVVTVWLTEPPGDAEVLVEVTLPDPGEKGTWGQQMTSVIRTAVRQATAEVMPWAVATTRMVPLGDDA